MDSEKKGFVPEEAKAEDIDIKLGRLVKEKTNQETFENIESSIRNIDASIKMHLLEVAEKNPSDVDKIIDLYRDFSSNLNARAGSENVRDPKRIEEALKLANALLEIEPSEEGKEVADGTSEGMKILKQRYHGKE